MTVDGLTWVRAVLDGMAEPPVILAVLGLTTLLLEDVAIAAGVALAAQGVISWPASALAVGGGIALGDIGLYGLGVAARRVPWLRHRYVGARSEWARERIESRLGSMVLLARVIPGLRLATYTGCGFVRTRLDRFTAWVVVAVTVWTLGLYALSAALGEAIARRFGVPPAIAAGLPVLALAAVFPLVRWLRGRNAAHPAATNSDGPTS